jgi:hypothetical protein
MAFKDMVQEKFVLCGNRAGTLCYKEKMAAVRADLGSKLIYARSRVFIQMRSLVRAAGILVDCMGWTGHGGVAKEWDRSAFGWDDAWNNEDDSD